MLCVHSEGLYELSRPRWCATMNILWQWIHITTHSVSADGTCHLFSIVSRSHYKHIGLTYFSWSVRSMLTFDLLENILCWRFESDRPIPDYRLTACSRSSLASPQTEDTVPVSDDSLTFQLRLSSQHAESGDIACWHLGQLR